MEFVRNMFLFYYMHSLIWEYLLGHLGSDEIFVAIKIVIKQDKGLDKEKND